MKLIVHSVNVDAWETLKEYAERKFEKLAQYYDKIISVDVYFKSENTSEKTQSKIVEVEVAVPGGNIVVKKTGQSFEECVDLSIDTLKRQIIKKKEKEKAF